MQPSHRSRTVVSLLVLLAGCGAPVADGTYKGQPLVQITGTVQAAGAGIDLVHPYVGLVWAEFPSGPGASSTPTLIGDLTPIVATSFPASFAFDVFDPPPAATISNFSADDPSQGSFGEAIITAIDDVNGDGKFDIAIEPVTYSCPQGTSPCEPPGGQAAPISGSIQCETGGLVGPGDAGASNFTTTCTAQIATIAAPDRLLGSASSYLFYVATPAPAGEMGPNGADGLLNAGDLSVSGYYISRVCDLTAQDPAFSAAAQSEITLCTLPDGGGGECVPTDILALEFLGATTPVTITLNGAWPAPSHDPKQWPLCTE